MEEFAGKDNINSAPTSTGYARHASLMGGVDEKNDIPPVAAPADAATMPIAVVAATLTRRKGEIQEHKNKAEGIRVRRMANIRKIASVNTFSF